ncbi:MAG: NADP-dependent malic enzyme [Planctomycetota bacterium]|jgi:malate dehydrogenase (oxaloacetate-decarboxylating)(NADP+)
MARNIRDQDALDYHSRGKRGKIEVVPTKPCFTQRDLSLAYTPGVAVPCLRIKDDPDEVFNYTAKGNLVAVITNGTAVLGLGAIGPAAGKPVMEGKGVLFKRFAEIDVFDIEVDSTDVEEFINFCRLIAPTFGGINLEDIRAPECFEIEPRLQELLDIPVFHDDQHGTAIISAAGLLNACEIAGKDIADVRIVFSGAGAASLGCAEHFLNMGATKENLVMIDRAGVIYQGRDVGMNQWKEKWAIDTELRTLDDAMKGTDVFIGLSVADMLSKDHVRSMAENPIIFAMANPDPEITYEDAKDARSDVIMATGRSDYPNQVNNVLGFPFIFRGALDVRARAINDEMKLAASRALAELAKQDVPDQVRKAYGVDELRFGPDYIIPKPLDPRVLLWEAPAVAKAAVDTGVARRTVEDWDEYRESLERIYGPSRGVVRSVIRKARRVVKRIVFPEGSEGNILRAAQILIDEKIARPILVGRPDEIRERIEERGLDITEAEIVDPRQEIEPYAARLHQLRRRKGMMPHEASMLVKTDLMRAVMMVHMDEADGMVCGINRTYSETLAPSLRVLRMKEGVKKVSGMYAIAFPDRTIFFADATVNIDPTAEDLAEIALLAGKTVKSYFDIEPRIAMLSFSSFGSTRHPYTAKVREATEIVRAMDPTLVIDGEIQADAALDPELTEQAFPHSIIKGDANILVFPCLNAANIAYKLMERLAKAEIIGPIIMGMRKPVSVVNHWSTVDQIVNIAAITALAAASAPELNEESHRQHLLDRMTHDRS